MAFENEERVVLVDHPMVRHKLAILRDKTTPSKQFRELVRELAMFETFEVTRDLPLEEVFVETPVAEAKCKIVKGRKMAIVPILRAGLGMVEGVLDLVPPHASVIWAWSETSRLIARASITPRCRKTSPIGMC